MSFIIEIVVALLRRARKIPTKKQTARTAMTMIRMPMMLPALNSSSAPSLLPSFELAKSGPASVGLKVVGCGVGDVVPGLVVGTALVGATDGDVEGAVLVTVGLSDGATDGRLVGSAVGWPEGTSLGEDDGRTVGDTVGASVRPVHVKRHMS